MKSAPARYLTVALLAAGGLVSASGATLTFDELPSQPVDGLSTQGVTFSFEVGGSPSLDASYNVDLGLGTTAAVSDSVLEGDASGRLGLTFATPTGSLSFGLALLAGADLAPGAVIDLYDSGNLLLDSISLNTLGNPGLGISEALFAWTGPPIASAWIDFEDQAGRFAIDNLTFDGGQDVVPEPGTVALGCGVSGLVVSHWVRRRRQNSKTAGTH